MNLACKSFGGHAYWLLSLLFLLTSCQEFLEDELLSETSVDYLYSTPAGLEDAVVGLYALNRAYIESGAGNNDHRALIMQAKSDLTLGRAGEIALYARLGWGRDLTTGGQGGYSHYWRNYYRIVDRANAVIAAAETVAFDESDLDRKNRILGEARTMRANAYFTLYRMFNNIFITTEPTSPENAFDVPQDKSSPEEIFALINADLDFAIENLDWTTPQFGRWTQASARHLKAKVAMWQGNWAEAITQSEAVINNGSYNLLSNTGEVFAGDLNHSETLFAIQFEDGVIGGGTRNQIHFNLVANYLEIPGVVRSSENGGRGASLLVPNNYLVDLLAEDPNDTRDDGTYMISRYRYNDPATLPPGVQIGDTINIYDRDSEDPNNFRQYYKTLNPGVLKFQQRDADPNEANTIKNIMVYRLAETYLISAEAHMRQGNTAMALERLNAIRTRAGAAPVTDVTQETILDERARELFFEGQRWFTLKRMGVLVEYIQDHAGNDNLQSIARERITPIQQNIFIPEAEIQLLGPNYPQNEGY
ncbi:RagB/SusD family nutrient uptake outer membrane protein [Lewinella sp. JB7]|uniref:RagB/SusD family nutrient uptake outer membrane protein n=1 Tax=Lewinella sp. JB7 TaxID=2962887 RepID=UPI0020C94791|nr:RagB/SusD family nutrient uptake outer membrane protein [Lewinella sp. JB7]MCP9236111.1 RagB/SusD family nutrient uptake outer membrane protein [Lewinella sp. JB7]